MTCPGRARAATRPGFRRGPPNRPAVDGPDGTAPSPRTGLTCRTSPLIVPRPGQRLSPSRQRRGEARHAAGPPSGTETTCLPPRVRPRFRDRHTSGTPHVARHGALPGGIRPTMTLVVLPCLLLLWCWLKYGLLPLRWQNPYLAGPDAPLQRACRAAARGRWEPAAQLFGDAGQDWERRSLYAQRLGDVAARGSDRWLKEWTKARPEDPDAALVVARARISYAWELRGAAYADWTSQSQFDSFHRELLASQEDIGRVAALHPRRPHTARRGAVDGARTGLLPRGDGRPVVADHGPGAASLRSAHQCPPVLDREMARLASARAGVRREVGRRGTAREPAGSAAGDRLVREPQGRAGSCRILPT